MMNESRAAFGAATTVSTLMLMLVACGGAETAKPGEESTEEDAARSAGVSYGNDPYGFSGTSNNCPNAVYGSNCGTRYHTSGYGGSGSGYGGSGSAGSGSQGSGNTGSTGGTRGRGYHQSCSNDGDCIDSLVCNAYYGWCDNLKGYRQGCTRDSECIDTLLCNFASAECLGKGGLNTRCTRDAECIDSLSCGPQGHCSF